MRQVKILGPRTIVFKTTNDGPSFTFSTPGEIVEIDNEMEFQRICRDPRISVLDSQRLPPPPPKYPEMQTGTVKRQRRKVQ